MKKIANIILRLALAATVLLPGALVLAQQSSGVDKTSPEADPPFNGKIERRRQEGLDARPCFLCPFAAENNAKTVIYWLNLHSDRSNRNDAVNYNINGADDSGRTALFLAAQNGRAHIVNAILAYEEVNVNKPDGDGRTPIFAAASGGHLRIVNALLQHKNKPNLDVRGGGQQETALEAALRNGHYEIAKALKIAGAVLPAPQNTIWYALNNGDFAMAAAAFAAGNANFPYNGKPAILFEAVVGENVLLADGLIQDGAACGESYYRGRTALAHAAHTGNAKMIEILETAECVNKVRPVVCHDDGKVHRDGVCVECPEDDRRQNNECVPDYQKCFDQNMIYDKQARACAGCSPNEIRRDNECVEPPSCGSGEERGDDGISCVCADGYYRNPQGVCVALLSCGSGEERGDDGISCVCADGYYRNPQGVCVALPSCGSGEERGDDGISCVCVDGYYRNLQGVCVALPSCGSGEERGDDGISCVCAPGYYRNTEGECLLPSECTAPKIRAANGIDCICPNNLHETSAGECIEPSGVAMERCHQENKILANGECVECPEDDLRKNNECIPDYQKCFDQDMIYDGKARECTGCNPNQVRRDNLCVVPDCRDDQITTDDGFCACGEGRYESEGKCKRVCLSCEAYNVTSDSCECAPGLQRYNGECITPPICSGGQIVSADGRRCECPPDKPRLYKRVCHSQIICTGGRTHDPAYEGICRCMDENLPFWNGTACVACEPGARYYEWLPFTGRSDTTAGFKRRRFEQIVVTHTCTAVSQND